MKKRFFVKFAAFLLLLSMTVFVLSGCSLFSDVNDIDDIDKKMHEWIENIGIYETDTDESNAFEWPTIGIVVNTTTTVAELTPTTDAAAETTSIETAAETTSTEPSVTVAETSVVTTTTRAVTETTESGSGGGKSERTSDIYCYYYGLLNETERAVYLGLLETIKKGDEWASFSGVNTTAFYNASKKAVRALVYDHRELFEYGGGWSCKTRGDTFYISPSRYKYWQYNIATSKQQNEYNKKVDTIVNEINENCDTEYEMVKYAHNYIIKNSIYDTKSAEDVMKNPTSYNMSSDCIFTSYGCLVNGKCVCAGYAGAFKVILDRLGIKCVYVVGESDGVGHAWNRIIMDGESYYIDVTWDDTMAEEFDKYGNQLFPETTLYRYFNITTDELKLDHEIDDTFPQPAANGTKYNYFLFNGYVIDEYDLETFVAIVDAQKDETSVNVKFKNPSDVAKAKEEFIVKKGYYLVTWLDKFSYIFDEEDGYAILFYK